MVVHGEYQDYRVLILFYLPGGVECEQPSKNENVTSELGRYLHGNPALGIILVKNTIKLSAPVTIWPGLETYEIILSKEHYGESRTRLPACRHRNFVKIFVLPSRYSNIYPVTVFFQSQDIIVLPTSQSPWITPRLVNLDGPWEMKFSGGE